MRFKITPFTRPEYKILREQGEFFAKLWEIGHVFFVLFLTFAFVTPVATALAVMIDPEIDKERAWDAAESCMEAALLIAAIGFSVKLYASKKGRGV